MSDEPHVATKFIEWQLAKQMDAALWKEILYGKDSGMTPVEAARLAARKFQKDE